MRRECACSGRCGGELNRREFLQIMLAGAMGAVFVPTLPAGNGEQKPEVWQVSQGKLPPPRAARAYPTQTPRTYRGANLEYVLMPIGGIGTGTVWLDGQGKLSVWQIFNNDTEESLPHVHFALRLDGELYLLQTPSEQDVPAIPVIAFEGGYPIARLHYDTRRLPVDVVLEAFNPFIPLDAFHSALPCAVFRWTVRNRSNRPVDLSLLFTLPQSAERDNALDATPGYSRSVTSVPLRRPGAQAIYDQQTGRDVTPVPLYYLRHLTLPSELPGGWQQPENWRQLIEAYQTLEAGGVVLITSPRASFWGDLVPPWEVFEDFEKDSYEGWTVEGEAFGTKPHSGTTPGQQLVSGFIGQGLVNTYLPNDTPKGRLTSRPFQIQKRFIGFLIGGGNHPGETCINLLVDGKVVRTATGRNAERLEPAEWDVSDLIGKQAQIQIVDNHAGGWGHINIDHIVFADMSPVAMFSLIAALPQMRQALALRATNMRDLPSPPRYQRPEWTALGRQMFPNLNIEEWEIDSCLRLEGFEPGDWQVLAQWSDGTPLLLMRRHGNGTVVLSLAGHLPEWTRSWTQELFFGVLGIQGRDDLYLTEWHPRAGNVCVKTDQPDTRFHRWSALKDLSTGGSAQGVHGAIEAPVRLAPGEQRIVHFVMGWSYPHVERFRRRGNLYYRWFRTGQQAADYALQHLPQLWGWTQLYHQTMYQSNLPPLMLDAITSQAVILRSPTCFWSDNGYFAGYEGSYACCPLNCTHVWNYAQTHARLFPEIGRNMRESDLLVYLHPDGETSHRQHWQHEAFIDGQCATICAAYREHLTAPDNAFLKKIWSRAKLATEWLIRKIDSDEDGVPSGIQWNTYDCAVSGATTFIGSQYLCALAAAEQMALRMGDQSAAQRYRRIRLAGSRNQHAQLWNGEYYIQKPGTPAAHDYNTGCHSDQLLGQWWAHQLGLGYLYPREAVRRALQSIYRYNFRYNMIGHLQFPRRYLLDNEAGLLMCTWPRGGRPDPFIVYADEVWTGIEYAVAGLMLWEGMVEEAVHLVNTTRSRYDGRRRDGVNSGPGGNPFNELECGKFYARAMSSFGLLLAAQGLILDTPSGVLGFAPRWQPQDHRSFFITGTGWGLFAQKRTQNEQREEIDLRYGSLRLREMVFQVPQGVTLRSTSVRISGRVAQVSARTEGNQVVLRFAHEQNLQSPAQVTVLLRW